MDELYDKVGDLVKQVAKETHLRWAKILPADDIEQELWLYILESPSVQEFLLKNENQRVKGPLTKKANSICSKERVDYDHFTGNYYYNTPEVSMLLEGKVSGKTIPSDMSADLDLGLDALLEEHPQYFETIHDVYWERLDYSDNARSKRKSRALTKLAELMNRKRSQREMDRTEGPGTKTKITEEDY